MIDLELGKKGPIKIFFNILGVCIAILAIGGLIGGIIGLFFPSDNINFILFGYFSGYLFTILFILDCIIKIKIWKTYG